MRAIIEPEDAWSRRASRRLCGIGSTETTPGSKRAGGSGRRDEIPARALTRLGTRAEVAPRAILNRPTPSNPWRRGTLSIRFLGESESGRRLDAHARMGRSAARFLDSRGRPEAREPAGCQVNLGHALKGRGSSQEALVAFARRSTRFRITPGRCEHRQHGGERSCWDDALASCRKAIDLQPKGDLPRQPGVRPPQVG